MDLLKECFDLHREIREIDEKIEEIKAILYTPKCQDLSGMPKGEGNGESIIDKLITKKSKLEQMKLNATKVLSNKWAIVEKACNNAHISNAEIMLLMYRYYYGLSWKAVTNKMRDYAGQEWNENKTFRVHRIVLCKINKEIKKSA